MAGQSLKRQPASSRVRYAAPLPSFDTLHGGADCPLVFAGFRPRDRYGRLWQRPCLPRRDAERKFLFAGATGTGKTLSIRVLLRSVLQGFVPGTKRQAMLYDAKGDMRSIVRGILYSLGKPPGGEPWPEPELLNPFDARAHALDFAEEFRGCQSPTNAADNFAATLIPNQGLGTANHFFTSSAQQVVSAVVQLLAKRAEQNAARGHVRSGNKPAWTLRDVVTIACDARLIQTFLDSDPWTRRILALLNTSPETKGNILQTVAAFLWPLQASAAACDYHLQSAKRRLTYKRWLQGRGIYILCGSYIYPHTVEPLNALLIEFLRQRLMVAPEIDWVKDPKHPENWLFLDEFPDLNPVPEMVTYFTKSRSKGGVQVIGFQSIEQLIKKYGPEIAKAIVAQFRNLFLTNASCPTTAQYFADRFATFEELIRLENSSQGWSTGPGGTSVNYSTGAGQTFVERKAVMPQSLMAIPDVQTGRKGEGAVVSGCLALRNSVSFVRYSAEFDGLVRAASTVDEPDFLPLAREHCTPRPLSVDDFRWLRFEMPHTYFK